MAYVSHESNAATFLYVYVIVLLFLTLAVCMIFLRLFNSVQFNPESRCSVVTVSPESYTYASRQHTARITRFVSMLN